MVHAHLPVGNLDNVINNVVNVGLGKTFAQQGVSMSTENRFFGSEYADDDAFWEFVNREFDQTAAGATLEEMAAFAFGGIDEAIQAYKRRQAELRGVRPSEDGDETT